MHQLWSIERRDEPPVEKRDSSLVMDEMSLSSFLMSERCPDTRSPTRARRRVKLEWSLCSLVSACPSIIAFVDGRRADVPNRERIDPPRDPLRAEPGAELLELETPPSGHTADVRRPRKEDNKFL